MEDTLSCSYALSLPCFIRWFSYQNDLPSDSLLLDEEAGDTFIDPDVLGLHADPDAAGVETTNVVDLPVVKASAAEVAAHDAMLEKIRKSGACVWDFD